MSQEKAIIVLQETNLESTESSLRAGEVFRHYFSKNTLRAHQAAIKYWKAWASANGIDFDSIQQEHIILFILQHSEGMPAGVEDILLTSGIKDKKGSHSFSTIRARILGLLAYCHANGLPNPVKHSRVWELLGKLKKLYPRPIKRATAVTKDILFDLADTCDEKTLIGLRDKALLLFAWGTGGRRASEVTAAVAENLKPDGSNFLYNVARSKTDQEGEGHIVPVRGMAAVALKKWLEASQIAEGALFRSISRHGKLGAALSVIDISRIIKKRCALSGHNPKEFSSHSCRSGFVTEAGKRGIPIGDVMSLTGHKSILVAQGYYRTGALRTNAAANML